MTEKGSTQLGLIDHLKRTAAPLLRIGPFHAGKPRESALLVCNEPCLSFLCMGFKMQC